MCDVRVAAQLQHDTIQSDQSILASAIALQTYNPICYNKSGLQLFYDSLFYDSGWVNGHLAFVQSYWSP